MTSFDDLDRRLTARLDDRAAPRAPEGLSDAITERVDGTAQRPAWATLERWFPMETRAQFGAVPRAVIIFALLALLTLVMASAIAIGTRLIGVSGGEIVTFDRSGQDVAIVAAVIASQPAWQRVAE